MKKILMTAFLAAGAVLLINACSNSRAEGKLQVIYTGNIKGNVAPCGCKVSKGGIARLATFVNRSRDADANWLMVDCGNFVDRPGSGGGCTSKCAFMVNSYQDLKYDALNIGRQEVWMGYETIKAMSDSARNGTKYVSANLLGKKSGKPVVEPFVIREYHNMKIGIVGLLDDADFPATSAQIDTNNLKVGSYMDAAKKYIPSLAKKTDAVVLLCELSSARVESLLAVVPQIDLVISSGALRTGETPAKFGKTQIVSAGASGYNGHYAMLEFNPSFKDSIGFNNTMVSLDSSWQEPGPWLDKLTAFNNPTPITPTTSINPSQPNTQPVSITTTKG